MPETVGIDFLLKAGTSTIGGREDATLNLERDASDLAPTQGTGSTFRRQLVGLKDFSIDTDALWLTGGSALNGFSPTVTVNPSASSPPTLERISEVTLSIERELVEFANSSNAEYLARQPSLLSVSSDITVDVDASQFYSTGNASRQLVDAWDSTSGAVDVDIALPNGNTSFESTFVVSTIDLPTPTDDAAEATFTLESTGVVTETIDSALGSGLNELLTNIFQDDPSSLTAELTTTQTGNVEFTGPVFPSSVEITIPVEGSEDGVNTSVTLDAAGALTIQETA
ncbi:phage tail protein [Salinibacter ruber]|uniref:phage tail protein n=1 Tax=Salinibacter ruber TaxID=146919 RepID=UPI002169613C|nr:phage tail protein [Salinibacter ruber]MCS3611004.1 putative secreted protein [Salinibacter ruber]